MTLQDNSSWEFHKFQSQGKTTKGRSNRWWFFFENTFFCDNTCQLADSLKVWNVLSVGALLSQREDAYANRRDLLSRIIQQLRGATECRMFLKHSTWTAITVKQPKLLNRSLQIAGALSWNKLRRHQDRSYLDFASSYRRLRKLYTKHHNTPRCINQTSPCAGNKFAQQRHVAKILSWIFLRVAMETWKWNWQLHSLYPICRSVTKTAAPITDTQQPVHVPEIHIKPPWCTLSIFRQGWRFLFRTGFFVVFPFCSEFCDATQNPKRFKTKKRLGLDERFSKFPSATTITNTGIVMASFHLTKTTVKSQNQYNFQIDKGHIWLWCYFKILQCPKGRVQNEDGVSSCIGGDGNFTRRSSNCLYLWLVKWLSVSEVPR